MCMLRLFPQAMLVASALAMGSCSYDRPGFDCGEPVQPGSQVVRVCDRPREVCVCATRKCAVLDTTCPLPGLRYVEPPYGLVTEHGESQCVAAEDGGWLTGDTQAALSCASVPPPAPDAGAPDASSDPSPDAAAKVSL